jgi:hypothetical protein
MTPPPPVRPPPGPAHQPAPRTKAAPARVSRVAPEEMKGTYKFSADKMLSLIGALVAKGELPAEAAQQVVGIRDQGTFGRYARFLLSGQLIEKTEAGLKTTDPLRALWTALLAQDIELAARGFRTVPSFDELCRFAEDKGQFDPNASAVPITQTARPSYFMLGEALGIWLRVVGHGVVATPRVPEPAEFAGTGRSVYLRASQAPDAGEWLLTGRWLEALALEHGIHPVVAKRLVARARKDNLFRVLAEGSTPDNRFEDHLFWALSLRDGAPCIERVFLYHGDFLLPGTAAVRIKIETADNAT